MNYIELVNNVWNMREQGIISAHEQDFYMYLMHRCNVLFWKNPFHQSSEVLCSVLGMNRNMLTTRRKRLKQLGLIDYKEGKTKSKPAEYTILYTRNDKVTNHAPDVAPDTSDDKKQKRSQKDFKLAKEENIRFCPPTTQDVEKYCTDRNNNVDALRFVDFYTAKGWMLGKNKMKDWKAAVRTWERNSRMAEHPATNYKQNNALTDERF